MRPNMTKLVIAAGIIGCVALSICSEVQAEAGSGAAVRTSEEAAKNVNLSAFPWSEDLAAAQKKAHAEGKLVLCFQLLGDLTAPDC